MTTDGDGRVVALEVSGLTGELAPELGNLTSLRKLEISGSELPEELPLEVARLADLRELTLSGNEICGGLPLSWPALPS